MRLLSLYRHYWPDATPHAQLLKAILERSVAEGHEATVVTAQPSYNGLRCDRQPWRELVGGVHVRRVRLMRESKGQPLKRLFNSFWFVLRGMLHVMCHRRYDLVIANGHPPVLMGLALCTLRLLTGTRYVLHLQDIHPESLRAVGSIRSEALFAAARWLDTLACRHAERIVTLSQDMADSLARRGIARENVTLIQNAPLCVDHDDDRQNPTESTVSPIARIDDRPLFLFAGNLGNFQALDLVVAAARQVARQRPLRLALLGTGAAKARLTELAGEELGRSIEFHDHVATGAAFAAMQAADFGLVSLHPEVFRYAFPSKTMTYLAAGCPVLAIVEPDSELARVVEHEALGYVAGNDSIDAIAEAMHRACDQRAAWTAESRRRLQRRGVHLFGQERMLAAWSTLLTELSSASPLEVATPADAAIPEANEVDARAA